MSDVRNRLRQHLPGWFQRLPGLHEDPLIAALEECLERHEFSLMKSMLATRASEKSVGEQRAWLNTMGAETLSLSSEEVVEFGKIMRSLNQASITVSGVSRLAELYFPGALVRQNREIPRTLNLPATAGNSRSVRVVDRFESGSFLWICLPPGTLERTGAQARHTELLKNLSALLPIGVELQCSEVHLRVRSPGELRLVGNISMQGVLTCPTFQR